MLQIRFGTLLTLALLAGCASHEAVLLPLQTPDPEVYAPEQDAEPAPDAVPVTPPPAATLQPSPKDTARRPAARPPRTGSQSQLILNIPESFRTGSARKPGDTQVRRIRKDALRLPEGQLKVVSTTTPAPREAADVTPKDAAPAAEAAPKPLTLLTLPLPTREVVTPPISAPAALTPVTETKQPEPQPLITPVAPAVAPLPAESLAVDPTGSAGVVALDQKPAPVTRPVRLAGAVNARDTIRAIVLPVSIGDQKPTWSAEELSQTLFGEQGWRATLAGLSQHKFQIEADIFPPLIEPSVSAKDILMGATAPAALSDLVRRAVTLWAGRANLASYDNDGPDGIPMSGDDDGAIDLLYVVVEVAGYPPVLRVPLNMEIRAGRAGRLPLIVRDAQVLIMPPKGSPEHLVRDLSSYPLVQAFDVLGVSRKEIFFPVPFEKEFATAAPLKLGWLETRDIPGPGTYTSDLNKTVVRARIKGAARDSYWLIERRPDAVYISYVVAGSDGVLETTKVMRHEGDRDLVRLPVTAAGTSGALLEVSWESRTSPVRFVWP